MRLSRRAGAALAIGSLVAAFLAAADPAVSSGGSTMTAAASDPDLEPGFPVQTYETGGTFSNSTHTLVGNIDADPYLEIVVSALGAGPLYAWNHDGTLVPGWPAGEDWPYVAYPALAQLAGDDRALEVITGFWTCCTNAPLAGYDGDGSDLPGWPRDSNGWLGVPPTVADLDGGGLEEIFTSESDSLVHGYRASGFPLRGWPQGDVQGYTMAIGDLDGDGVAEIVAKGGYPETTWLYAWRRNGQELEGFAPLLIEKSTASYPVLGDVDGDGETEIVLGLLREDMQTTQIGIVSNRGVIERRIDLSGFGGAILALADFTGDGVPEIVATPGTTVTVMRGDGSVLPGWPVELDDYWAPGYTSGPVVGDIDGDGSLDVALELWNYYYGESEVRVWNSTGQLNPHFPKKLPLGTGAVPAIADFDLDGRNELIVTSTYWSGFSGLQDKVWAYDLKGPGPYGPIPWGQFGGGPDHRSAFPHVDGQWPPTEEVISHPRSVSLKLSGQLAAWGRVSVADGSIPCVRSVPVDIEYEDGDGYVNWSTVGRAISDPNGFYRVQVPDQTGYYRARLDIDYPGPKGTHVCLSAMSPIRPHGL